MTKRGKPVGAAIVAANVLRLLSEAPRPLNANQVATRLGIYRGTAYNILWSLEDCGFVKYSENAKGFSLSINLLSLTQGILGRSGIMDHVRPILFSLNETFGVTAYLGKIGENRSVFILDAIGPAFRDDLYSSSGRRYPGFAGAPGVVIAAFAELGRDEIKSHLNPADWYRPPSVDQFLERMRKARKDGFSIDKGDRWRRLLQVSAPVLDDDGTHLLMLTVVSYLDRLTNPRIKSLARSTRDAAWQISLLLDRIDVN
jgi:DNA-binding IclR family transcriptional regulator